MFKKFLASVGIGSAKVDTVLQQEQYYAGEEVKGTVRITGGNTQQNIDSIYLTLSASYVREVDDKKVSATYALDKFRLTDPITIGPGATTEVPFSFVLPIETPVTFGLKKVWIHTGLDIKNSVDPGDTDYIEVLPSPLLSDVLEAVQSLGFRLRQAECEELPYRLRKRVPFAQEFEFIPVSGPFYRKLDELELLVFPQSARELSIMMEIDRKAKGLAGLFSEALDMDETRVHFTVTPADLTALPRQLEQVISKYC
ncbi:sporulation protein [Ectobacillus panaciterrae]|uniref:sporulation protein n=1 Tax=Ectobacillus panaciterrae TaxID=363872 RepID=UPI0004208CCB|nr:sporulation protein [Ectobacillus panaciterrae]